MLLSFSAGIYLSCLKHCVAFLQSADCCLSFKTMYFWVHAYVSVYCRSKHAYVGLDLCEDLSVLAQANLSKQVFVIAREWMTCGASLESPVTLCGGDGGQGEKELTRNAGKTIVGGISVFFLTSFCSWKGFAEHAGSFSASLYFIFMHLLTVSPGSCPV